MKCFIFCTSYLSGYPNRDDLLTRYNRWIQYYETRRQLLGAERLILIDDGSLASDLDKLDADVKIIDIEADHFKGALPQETVIFRFPEHYGRQSVKEYPGWWRSFSYAAEIAIHYSFAKVIHIESDAYVLSHRLAHYLHSVKDGWTALWATSQAFPETQIQVICGRHIFELHKFYRAGPHFWFTKHKRIAERILPFTHVVKHFTGDRYGEFTTICPHQADYVCQARNDMDFTDRLTDWEQKEREMDAGCAYCSYDTCLQRGLLRTYEEENTSIV